jgi:hypothetical protein
MKYDAGRWPIAIALIICTLLATNSYQKIRRYNGTISVKGCAEKHITSDFAKWEGTISATGKTLAEAYAKLEKDNALLEEYFQKEKVDSTELTLAAIHTNTLYKTNEKGYATNEIEGYTLSRHFSIATTHIELVKRLSQQITSLIKEGVEIVSYAPQYLYRHLDELKILMLAEASRDARSRADAMLTNTQSTTGGLRYAQQGVFQITPAYSTSVSDYGEYDTTSIEKTIKAVVTMEFSVE